MTKDWRQEWKAIAVRFVGWRRTSEGYMAGWAPGQLHSDRATAMLVREAQEIRSRVRALELPSSVRDTLKALEHDVGVIAQCTQGAHAIMYQTLALDTIMAPLQEAYAASDVPQRALVDRAFLHLKRTLTVDRAARERWREAFDEGETRCEQLGALHLLLHGIYSFKADASGGRTDLILCERMRVDADVQSAVALVLTEWKLVRSDGEAAAKAFEGMTQAARYGESEVAGLELRSVRYVVLVSLKGIQPNPDELRDGVTYRFVSVALEPDSPSVQARRLRDAERANKGTRAD